MKEEWLFPGAVVPVDVETTAALVAEIKRLIDVVGGMALAEPQEKYKYGTPLLDAMTGKANEALDKKAENARELGLDYEPIQCPICKAEDSPYPKCGCVTYVEQPAQQEPVAWGVDWGRAGDIPCVSIIKRLPGGGIEVVAVEYAPYTFKEKNT